MDLAYDNPVVPTKAVDINTSDKQCLLESEFDQTYKSLGSDAVESKVTSDENTSYPESRPDSRVSNTSAVSILSPISSKSAVSLISTISKSEDTVMEVCQVQSWEDVKHSDEPARNLENEDIAKYIDDDDDNDEANAMVTLLDPATQSPRLVNYLTNESSGKDEATCGLITQSAYYRRMRLNTASTLDLPVSLNQMR